MLIHPRTLEYQSVIGMAGANSTGMGFGQPRFISNFSEILKFIVCRLQPAALYIYKNVPRDRTEPRAAVVASLVDAVSVDVFH